MIIIEPNNNDWSLTQFKASDEAPRALITLSRDGKITIPDDITLEEAKWAMQHLVEAHYFAWRMEHPLEQN